MLGLIYYMRPPDLPDDFVSWKGPKDIPFTRVIRNTPVKGTTASLRSYMITLGRLKIRGGKVTNS